MTSKQITICIYILDGVFPWDNNEVRATSSANENDAVAISLIDVHQDMMTFFWPTSNVLFDITMTRTYSSNINTISLFVGQPTS